MADGFRALSRTLFRSAGSLPIVALLAAIVPSVAPAQDTFEVQVYEYATVPRGMWNLETHANYTLRGTKTFDGTVAPTNRQSHLTFELTRGITDYFELAGYLVLAHRDDAGGNALVDYVGYRIRPRVRLPESWNLPAKISLSTEVGFPNAAYESSRTTLEVRPVVERGFGKWTVDVNPTVGRVLRGPGSNEGWDLEPGARLGYAVTPKVDLSIEYYGAYGAVSDILPAKEQVHLIFPGADIAIGENRVLNFGIGANLTDEGTRAMLKMRYGWMFGGKG
jgi:hypothetical protein